MMRLRKIIETSDVIMHFYILVSGLESGYWMGLWKIVVLALEEEVNKKQKKKKDLPRNFPNVDQVILHTEIPNSPKSDI
jgi:hypothetical protein